MKTPHAPSKSLLSLTAIFASWMLLSSHCATAAVTVYSGTLTVNDSSPIPPDLVVGDVFAFSFSLDDSITDSDPDPDSAVFTNLITGFTMSKVSGSGTWVPSGTFTSSTSFHIGWYGSVAEAYPLYPPGGFTGTGFPTLGGEQFGNVYFGFQTYTEPNDTGSGQTFAEIYGGLLTHPNWGGYESGIRQGSGDFSYAQTDFTIGVSSVPEPGRFLLASIGLCGLVLRRNRQG